MPLNEINRIDNLLLRSMRGEAWYGPGLFELIKDISAEKAGLHPVEGMHSIWELTEHITAWQNVTVRRLNGEDYNPSDEENWPVQTNISYENWEKTVENSYLTYQKLRETITSFPESKLDDHVPGKHYTYYVLLHGIVNHNIYHTGQIAILKKTIISF